MHGPKTAQLRLVLLAGLLSLMLLAVPTGASAGKRDSDGDRMADRWEKRFNVTCARVDRDGDGLVNLGEYRARTDPRDADSNSDGDVDGDEDPDRDRVDNHNELRGRTHPLERDSDGDGRRDDREDTDRDRLDNGGEDATGMDPADPDSDDDGTKDGDERAGVIESIDDDGLMTLRLARGGSVSGYVGDFTKVKCTTEHEHEGRGGKQDDPDESKDDEDESDYDDGAEDDSGQGAEDDADEEYDDSDAGDELSFERDVPEEGLDELPGEDSAGDSKDYDDNEYCSVDDLTEGMAVHEAELRISGDGPLFVEVEIIVE
jgi:hypothetical protein